MLDALEYLFDQYLFLQKYCIKDIETLIKWYYISLKRQTTTNKFDLASTVAQYIPIMTIKYFERMIEDFEKRMIDKIV
jgi:hypothetical protein